MKQISGLDVYKMCSGCLPPTPKPYGTSAIKQFFEYYSAFGYGFPALTDCKKLCKQSPDCYMAVDLFYPLDERLTGMDITHCFVLPITALVVSDKVPAVPNPYPFTPVIINGFQVTSVGLLVDSGVCIVLLMV
jgi:hypothetical protein